MSLAAFVDEAAIVTGAAELRGAASTVAFDRVSVAYRGAVVLKPLTLEVAAGEILAMIGPSGSGKTTALRAVAGFVRPASGRIRIGGADVTDLPPYARGLAMVVQNYALFPHMRVFDNVAFGLHARRAAKALVESAGRRGAEGRRHDANTCGAIRASFPAASSSASRSPARWRCDRRCCCSTSRSPRSTRRSAARWSKRSRGCTPSCPTSPFSTSPTTRARR